MTAVKAFLLGLIQGVAEFLPISSSGHLELSKNILGLAEVPIVFDVILHIATLLVVVLVFRKRIGGIFAAMWRFASKRGAPLPEDKENLGYVVPVLIATVVTAVIGFVIEKYVDQGSTRAVASRMLLTAAILGATAFARPGTRTPSGIGPKRAFLIGIAQGIGVFSGISRSGITISAGLASGLERGTAGEFSFLLSIPAILGAFILTLKDAGDLFAQVSVQQLGLAFVTAFAAGYIALKFLMKVIKSGKIFWFAPYLLVVGILGLILG